ncbi:hypothetical protein R3P38DRAFT_3023400 [Favolaschia claudopus]|uniref:Uncharacterized protein n=1 Tax=Favolaschia claudopus TaxID=2862362 RepID=A0AAW0AIH8_9AGAR
MHAHFDWLAQLVSFQFISFSTFLHFISIYSIRLGLYPCVVSIYLQFNSFNLTLFLPSPLVQCTLPNAFASKLALTVYCQFHLDLDISINADIVFFCFGFVVGFKFRLFKSLTHMLTSTQDCLGLSGESEFEFCIP